MVIVKFKKIDEGVFFNKANIERIMKRVFLLSGIDAKFQFELLGATPLGIESLCEFLEVKTSLDSSVVESSIEHNLPPYWEIENVFETDVEFSKHGLVGQYHITLLDGEAMAEVEKVLKKEPTETLRSFDVSADGVLCLVKEDEEKIKNLIEKIKSAANCEVDVVKEELYYVNGSGEVVEIGEES